MKAKILLALVLMSSPGMARNHTSNRAEVLINRHLENAVLEYIKRYARNIPLEERVDLHSFIEAKKKIASGVYEFESQFKIKHLVKVLNVNTVAVNGLARGITRKKHKKIRRRKKKIRNYKRKPGRSNKKKAMILKRPRGNIIRIRSITLNKLVPRKNRRNLTKKKLCKSTTIRNA